MRGEEDGMAAFFVRVLAAGLFFFLLSGAPLAPDGDPASGTIIFAQKRSLTPHRPPRPAAALYPPPTPPAPAPAAPELPVEAFRAFLREPANDMPASSAALLSDKEAVDMWAWLHSLPGRKPAKDFPLLNQ